MPPEQFYYKEVRITSCALAVLALTPFACTRRGDMDAGLHLTGGDIKIGEHLIYTYGCGSCHVIPGVAEANGKVGPSLQEFGSRYYISGLLVNTPENLLRWVSKPQDVHPGSAMPDLGVTEQQARDIAAYLYTLR